jgi:hypothetical protein
VHLSGLKWYLNIFQSNIAGSVPQHIYMFYMSPRPDFEGESNGGVRFT